MKQCSPAEDFTTNGWATDAVDSIELFGNKPNILPTTIPHFAMTEDGEKITHRLLLGERNIFQQMIAKHKSRNNNHIPLHYSQRAVLGIRPVCATLFGS